MNVSYRAISNIVLVFALTACGGGLKSNSKSSTASSVNPSAPAPAPAPTPAPAPAPAPAPTSGPVTSLHFSDGNSSGAAGFNLADVGSVSELNALPSTMKGLVYLGLCNGADSNFISTVQSYVGNAKLFGFYLMDEPDPSGKYNTLCSPANLMAESDYIHQNLPGAKTFIVLMNYGSVLTSPTYTGMYTPSNSHIDLFGLDPYPCRSGISGGCQLSAISLAVSAANAAGIPSSQLVPVYQSFGCTDGKGSCTTDSGDYYIVPSVSQEQALIAAWGAVLPSPVFDYAYTWTATDIEVPLSAIPSLLSLFATRNAGAP